MIWAQVYVSFSRSGNFRLDNTRASALPFRHVNPVKKNGTALPLTGPPGTLAKYRMNSSSSHDSILKATLILTNHPFVKGVNSSYCRFKYKFSQDGIYTLSHPPARQSSWALNGYYWELQIPASYPLTWMFSWFCNTHRRSSISIQLRSNWKSTCACTCTHCAHSRYLWLGLLPWRLLILLC